MVEAVVGELDEQLHVRVRRAAEALDEALAVALVRLHAQVVRGELGCEVLLGGVEVGGDADCAVVIVVSYVSNGIVAGEDIASVEL